jgi:rhodanese-related sulfurtransferase
VAPVLALLAAALLGAPEAPVAEPATAPATAVARTGIPPGEVGAAQARKLMDAGVKVVDVRSPQEFAQGHLPGALNIPHDELPRRVSEVGPPTTPVLVYCVSGRRSGLAAAALHAAGFREVFDLKAYQRWVDAERDRGR